VHDGRGAHDGPIRAPATQTRPCRLQLILHPAGSGVMMPLMQVADGIRRPAATPTGHEIFVESIATEARLEGEESPADPDAR